MVFIAETIRETEKRSYIGGVVTFLDAWKGPDDGFVRIINKQQNQKPVITLSYRCLDPSLVSKEVFENAYSTILMSGTMRPMEMFKDILGLDAELEEYSSPFPSENLLQMIIPETTTKFTARSQEMYRRTAEICAEAVNVIPGNSIVFFPSYQLRDSVNQYFINLCKKTTFSEIPNLSKEEKRQLLDKFKSYSKKGAVMLGVVSGSFGEGIDLPGDYLKAVIVVGLPLQVPDLETKAQIRYYEEEYMRGWDYGYLLPAMNKVFQNAGRVIRSETDRGAVIFLDERYSWDHYHRCFPRDNKIVMTKMFKERLQEFFK